MSGFWEPAALWPLLWVFLAALGGGAVQSSTGFGSGIVMMMFLPLFLPLLSSTAISTAVTVAMTLRVLWKYRSHVKPRLVLLPGAVYLLISTIAIRFSMLVDTGRLKFFFGLFLVAVALYFLFVASKIRLSPTVPAALACGGLSGVVSGLFGIGGPPMALYFLAALPEDKYAYLGTCQLFFTITCTYTTLVRAASGIFTPELLPLTGAGVAGILLGTALGGWLVEKINVEQMKKLIYCFLAFSGLLTLLDCL